MKVFQILNGFCYWDATEQFPTKESTVGFFHPDICFVEAPDYVFEGWGYMDGEFIRPECPDGFLYDEATGTFYAEDSTPPKLPSTMEELEAENKLLKAQTQMQSEQITFLEECILEMAEVVYA